MKRFFALVPAVLLLMLVGCGRQPLRLQHTDIAMGTVVYQNIYTEAEKNITSDIISLLKRLEEEELSWRLESAALYRVNQSAGAESGSLLSEELAELLRRCMEVNADSEGAFDVTLGKVVRLWNLDSWAAGEQTGVFVPPEDGALKEALAHCGRGKVEISQGSAGAVIRLPEGMQLDLGAVGKGIALDKVLAYLQTQEKITGATISVGGSVLTYGEKPDGDSWKVGILNPRDTSAYLGILSLRGQWCVSTSGDYERYVEVGGVRYHHIIDPATGYPADSGIVSVTVLAKDGFLSDALSTACFILGEEKGMALAKKYEVEVLFVREDGSVAMTAGMSAVYEAAE